MGGEGSGKQRAKNSGGGKTRTSLRGRPEKDQNSRWGKIGHLKNYQDLKFGRVAFSCVGVKSTC